jgi:hypothetical protein
MVEAGSNDALVWNQAKPTILIALDKFSESIASLIWFNDSSLLGLYKQSDFVHSDGSN